MSGKLGKNLGVVHDPRTLPLERYLVEPPKLPTSHNSATRLTFEMLGNDRFGDCTCAALGHAVEVWGRKDVVTERDALNLYDRTGIGDTGRYMLDVLNEVYQNRFASHSIRAFTKLAGATLVSQICAATVLLDVAYVGIAIPNGLDLDAPLWDVPHGWTEQDGYQGGHAVAIYGYTPRGNFDFVTWAEKRHMTPRFVTTFVDEAYAIVSPDQAKEDRINIAQLDADLRQIGAAR